MQMDYAGPAAPAPGMKDVLSRHWPLAGAAILVALMAAWAMLAPLGGASRELLFEIGIGQDSIATPAEIRLTRGVRDVLLLRNRAGTPVVFGPLRVKAGGELRLPFEEEGRHLFVCPPVAGGMVAVNVVAAPGPGWHRLLWRLDNLAQALRHLPLRAPEN